MIKELVQQRRQFQNKKSCLRVMDHAELSLSPSLSTITDVKTNRSPARTKPNSRKRKHSYVELPVNDPLPSDWEQCLDLQSGRMYYLNRRTLTKMWNRPYKEQKLDLELSIMPAFSGKSVEKASEKQVDLDDGGMAAAVCLNCHLLVMLYRSSPSCPNCRHMQTHFIYIMIEAEHSRLLIAANTSVGHREEDNITLFHFLLQGTNNRFLCYGQKLLHLSKSKLATSLS